MTDNLAIWNAVGKTDPAYTKAFSKGGGFKGTATNATWLAKRATETFGPIGIGWGLTVLDERVLDGAEGEKVHRVHVRLWYVWNSQRGEVEHFGQTTFVGKNKHGWFTDEEAPKKSLTDAMSKALSLLGFASDVHLGLFDDNKYVSDLRREFAQDNQPAQQQAAPKLTPAEELVAAIKGRPSLVALDKLWARADFKALFDELNAEDQAWVQSVDTSRRAEFESAAPLMAG